MSPLSNQKSRRQFLASTLAASAAISTSSLAAVHGSAAEPSQGEGSSLETVRLAIFGAGGRGGELARAIEKCEHAKIVRICDPDLSRAEAMAKKFGGTPSADLRVALEDPNVDAVVVATCNHWHCLASIWAIQAGKDVYVEKPLSHSQWEGRQVVDAAKKAGAVVQLGTQQRSDPIQQQAREFLHQDQSLGAIQYVQANRLGTRGPIGRRSTPLTIPESVNYDLWLGPAADEPIFRDALHYDWHWDWNTGSGEMGNWGVHVLDDVRNVAYQDSVTLPRRIAVAGGRVAWADAGQTPNVHFACFETDSFPTLIALSNLPAAPEKRGNFHAAAGRAVAGKTLTGPASGYVVVCEGGFYLGQRGRGEAMDTQGKTIRKFQAKVEIVSAHMQNFVDAVRSRDTSRLAAPVENGHHSTGWCNLANVGFRAASTFDAERLTTIEGPEAWPSLINEMIDQLNPFGVGRDELRGQFVLAHDPTTERFIGPHAEAANVFLKRDYRRGYEISVMA